MHTCHGNIACLNYLSEHHLLCTGGSVVKKLAETDTNTIQLDNYTFGQSSYYCTEQEDASSNLLRGKKLVPLGSVSHNISLFISFHTILDFNNNCSLSSHCKQDPIYVFPEMKLRGNIFFEFSVQCVCRA
jgi:hypothetical protein